MAEELIGNLGYETPQSDTKHQKLLECVLTRNSKLYLGKVCTEEQLANLNEEEVEKLYNNYEAKLSGQMVKSLGCSINNMYSMGACSAPGITNQDALSGDLENDPFLNSALQRFTCELYYRFGSFLAPLSVGIIMSRHYLLAERNKNGERMSGASGTGDISVLAVGYSMLGKKILKMTPASVQKFDLEDTGKLVAIIAASEITREYLIKQKILPDHINV